MTNLNNKPAQNHKIMITPEKIQFDSFELEIIDSADALESLKGGQKGDKDFFEILREINFICPTINYGCR